MKINLKNSSVIIFIVIALFYAIGNFIWWKLNTPIILIGTEWVHFKDIFERLLFFNAPLLALIMKILFYIFGRTYFDLEVIIVNYIFFLFALYFIYKIGIELQNKQVGNLSMILFALTPIIYILSRRFGHQDWHIMPPIIFNIYCLIKADNFKNKKWSIIYGISVGFGLLVKDEFVAYFFVPWLYVVIRSLLEKIVKEKIINILLTIFIGSLISGCHYFRFGIIDKIWYEPVKRLVPIFSFESLRVTSIGFSEYLLSPILFVLFVISFIWFLTKYKDKNKFIILLWIAIPWLIITFMAHYKLPEYQIAFVPAIILMISLYIYNIRYKIIKIILVPIIIVICLIQYLNFSYGICDIWLFNNKIDYKSYTIKYYDVAILDNGIRNNDVRLIVNKLKEYSSSKIAISCYTWAHMSSLLTLYDFNFFMYFFEQNIEEFSKNIEECDILVSYGENPTSFQIARDFYWSKDKVNNINKKKYIEKMITNINLVNQIINSKFYLVEEFFVKDDFFDNPFFMSSEFKDTKKRNGISRIRIYKKYF